MAWQTARNGSEFDYFDNVDPAIQALLLDENGEFDTKKKVDLGEYKYNGSLYGGKKRVWRTKTTPNQKQEDTIITSAPKEETVDETEEPSVIEEAMSSNSEAPAVKFSETATTGLLNIVDFEAIKVADIKIIKARLDAGWKLFGDNFRVAYVDGLVGMVKYG